MKLLNTTRRDRVLFSKTYKYANFFDDPSSYLQLGDNIYDLADPQTYANAARGMADIGKQGMQGARQVYGVASDMAGKAWETGKQVVKSLPNIHDNTGLSDAYLNTMSRVNPNAYAPDMPTNTPIPERLFPPGFKTPDIDYQKLPSMIDPGMAADIAETEEDTGLPSKIAGTAAGVLGGLYGTGKAAELALKKGVPLRMPLPLQQVYSKLPGIDIPPPDYSIGEAFQAAKALAKDPSQYQEFDKDRRGFIDRLKGTTNMAANSYMANFAFSAKPILNSTVRKKAIDAFNKKMGRLAQSGDLASSDSNVRKSALANATKIKERMRKA